MNDILRALGISAGILFLVVILIVIVSIAAVNRGAEQAEAAHTKDPVAESAVRVKETVPGTAAKAAKPVAAAADEISVPQILLLGVGLFVVTVVALLALSLIEHM
jgi:hypothetical protein